MGDDIPKDRVKDLKQESILCRVKYHNNLPDIACDPKFLTYPFESSRFVQYAATSLERNHKHELLCETDVGVDVDLIDPDVFKTDRSGTLHPDDEKLLEDDDPDAINDRKSRHQRSVSWLRKTEYLSTEHYNRFNKSEKIETKLGHNIKQRFTEELVYRDRDSQIKAIEGTFEAAKKQIKRHYSKPGVHAVEVMPILPDFKLWRYPCAQVIFDDDPSRKKHSSTEQKEEMNQAVIRGMVDETGDHFVVYFLPSDETKRLRRLDAENSVPFTDGASYEYEKTREYNWNVKNKTMANYDENYFFVFRKEDKDCPAGVYYNELETRVRLSKRRKMQPGLPGGAPTMPVQPSKMRLVVQHRDFTYEELQAQTARLDMLKHESEDEEEEEEADDQEETEDQQQESASKKIRGSSSGESDSDGSSSPAASPKGVSRRGGRVVESDADSSAKSVHSSQEDDNDVAVAERPPTTLRRQPARKRPTVASAVFSDDSDDDEEEDADEGQGHGIGARERGGAIQRSVSSDLSNDESRSPSPAPHPRQSRQSAGGRVKRARRAPFPEDASSGESDDDSRIPSTKHQQRSSQPPKHQQTVLQRQFDTESELSSLSD